MSFETAVVITLVVWLVLAILEMYKVTLYMRVMDKEPKMVAYLITIGAVTIAKNALFGVWLVATLVYLFGGATAEIPLSTYF
jgi:hypothetical protein